MSGTTATATIVAHGPGVATIKANAGTASSQIEVRVLNAKSVTPTSALVTMREGDSQTVTATVDAEAGALRTVSWTSENSTIATVTANGVVTGVSVGTATLRASATANPAISGHHAGDRNAGTNRRTRAVNRAALGRRWRGHQRSCRSRRHAVA